MDALILADDLSGAADCAAATGRPSIVALDWPPLPASEVTAVDLQSRKEPAAIAAARASRAVEQLLRPQTEIVYQKIDSLLRGNWAHELAAIRTALAASRGSPQLALIAPSWPERGRTLIDGEVLLDGSSLGSSGLRSDSGSRLDGSLASGLRLAGLGSIAIRTGTSGAGLRSQLSSAADSGVAAVICDAETRADLDAIAAASLALGHRLFWVGSGGLMKSLSDAVGGISGSSAARAIAQGPVLIAVGSASAVSRRQLERLGRWGTHVISLPPADLALPNSRRLDAIAGEIAAQLAAGSNVAIAIGGDDDPDLRSGTVLVQALVELLIPFVPSFGGLILTGGETARAVLAAAGVHAIRIWGEVEPGVPIGATLGNLQIPIVTKAGAFGGPDTLVHALAMLQTGDRDTPLPLQSGMPL